MAIAYPAISLAKLTRIGKQPSPGADRARAGLLDAVVGAALRTHLRRAEVTSRASFRPHIQQWRRTSTAMARCLAWMEGKPGAVSRQTAFAALPQALPDHELARIARDWVGGRLSRGIVANAAIHTALRPPLTGRHCGIPTSHRQG